MSGPERTVMFQLPTVLSGNLACVAGTMAGRTWELSAGTFVIGRNEGTDLALVAEPGVSKVHCKITAEGEHYLLVDCESRNGTIVNGAPIQRVKLRDGDEIRICGCMLRFSQHGGDTQIRVRNHDAAEEQLSDPSGPTTPGIPAMQARSEPPMLLPNDALAEVGPTSSPEVTLPPPAPRRSRGKTLLAWYASGLAGSLLFGGTASAVIFTGGTPPEAVALAEEKADGDKSNGPEAAAKGKTDDAEKADDKAAPGEVDKPAEGAKPAEGDKPAEADAPVPALDPAAVKSVAEADQPPPETPKAEEAKAEEPKAAEPKAAAEEERARKRARREEAAVESASEAPAEPSVRLFAATPEGGKSEALKTRGGKVKSVGAADGDTVERGQVLISFDAGGNEDEINTLKERIASLEGIDDDDARRQLKEARQRLDALLASSKSVPVVAGMSGKLSGFTVTAGDVLKNNQSVGRISEAGAPRKVRVTVDKGTRVKRGASATLILKKGGEATGTVSSTSGRTVVIDTGDTSGDDVDSVRF